MLARVRFDLRVPEEIEYFSNFSQYNNSIYSHLPDFSLGYNDTETGSDVLTIIEHFLNNTQSPVCGSKIMIVLKRYPNNTDLTDVVGKLQKYHIFLNVITSLDPSGGENSQMMYEVATRTNGLCFFQFDDKFVQSASWFASLSANPYLIYSTNPTVLSTGSMTLSPLVSQYWELCQLIMTAEDHGDIQHTNPTFPVIDLEWEGPGINASVYKNRTTLGGFLNANFFGASVHFNATTYNTTFNFSYDTQPQTLQIRVFSRHVIDYWLPYD